MPGMGHTSVATRSEDFQQDAGLLDAIPEESKMKTIRNSILCLGALLVMGPMLRAQDLSKYRNFSLGTSVAAVLRYTEQNSTDVNVTQPGPSLFQEVTWWTPSIRGSSLRPDSVERILFSFRNGELYKMSVTYDQSSTEGLTSADMVKSISVKYGPPTSVSPESDSTASDRYDAKERVIASWEDSQNSFNLVRSTFTDRFGLVIYSKRANAEAELAIAQAEKQEKQDGPKREAERQKKQIDDLDVARQKNQKSFRP
jgi:hypothetical protein